MVSWNTPRTQNQTNESVHPQSRARHPGKAFVSLHFSWHGSLIHLFPFVSLYLSPLSPSLEAWHSSLRGRVHLSFHLSSLVSQPGCLARLSEWTGSFVSLCLPTFVSRCLPARLPFICLPLSPGLDAWHGSPGGRVHLSSFVSLHLSGCLARLWFICLRWTNSFVFRVSGTALGYLQKARGPWFLDGGSWSVV